MTMILTALDKSVLPDVGTVQRMLTLEDLCRSVGPQFEARTTADPLG